VGVKLVATGMTKPNYVVSPSDMSGRLFVLEQAGRIRVIRNGVLLAKPYMDLSRQIVSTGLEQGILGLAFAPDFATSGRLFVSFAGRNGTTQLARFIVNPNADSVPLTSQRSVLTVIRPGPEHTIHYAGCLQFGPDKMLYMSSGDGGPAWDASRTAQDRTVLRGKMLRIDVLGVGNSPAGAPAYRIPAGNPYTTAAAQKAHWRPEIWQLGLRNPWRFSFDRATGGMYIGDVGQDRYEEIDFAPAGKGGQNFGWSKWEGDHVSRVDLPVPSRAGFTFPVAEEPHPELLLPGASMEAMIGGYVYRGATSPKLRGIYFFADWVYGDIWGMRGTPSAALAPPSLETTILAHTTHSRSSWGQDRSGEMLYLVDNAEGSVYRLMQR
jgi:glucose/arabinose dehydrogenase